MPLLQQNKEYTIDDIYALPDGQRAELIDGKMYMMRRQHEDTSRYWGLSIAKSLTTLIKKAAPAKSISPRLPYF